MCKTRRNKRAVGFTLIELLVVIGIIAVLIGILLPTLNKARAQSQAVVCRSNIRQVALAMFMYGQDNGGKIPGTFWQGPINLDWCGRMNANFNPIIYSHPLKASVLYRYLKSTDAVLGCPTNGRTNRFFDYTVPIRFAGAKTNLKWRVSYPLHPNSMDVTRAYFSGIPLLIEEHELLYNRSPNDDGSFASSDQFSRRHSGKCNIAYLDGSVDVFATPQGPQSRQDNVDEPQDLHATDLRVCTRAEPSGYGIGQSTPAEYGWVNNPK